jgi:integrase
LKFTRQRFQRGTLRKVARANNQWAWEYRYQDPITMKRKSLFLGLDKFPTQTAAERHLEAFVLKLNKENPTLAVMEPTFNAILDRFIEDERMMEIKQIRPGEQRKDDGLSYSTVLSYLSVIKRVRAKWGTTRIARMKPMLIQAWLKELEAAPKTKGHIKAVMYRLYEKAMLWEMVEWQRNPMEFVEIKGVSKRQKRPIILTVEQYYQILALLPEPYRTMVVVAQCTGLRAEEVLALEWQDIDFENLSMKVVRAVVHGRVKTVKTDYSEDELPLDPGFAEVLLTWKRRLGAEREAQNGISTPLVGLDLVFPSTSTGRHFHAAPAQQDYIRLAGCCLVACPKCGAEMGVWCLQHTKTPNGKRLPLQDERREAAGKKYGSVGWHTFRHTYRSWLDSTSAPIGVQQKLMRHAQVSTTMNVYGNALMTAKREANSKVVKMALRSA